MLSTSGARGVERRASRTSRGSALEAGAGVAAQGVVGGVEVVALADEEAERPFEVARGLGRSGEPAREQCARGVHLGRVVLLADGRAFKGGVTRIPADATPSDPALDYVDIEAETIPPHASADEAFERATASPCRRVIVLDDDRNLLGLLCLNTSRTGFCGSSA